MMDKSCWWIEGGRCYADPVERTEDGRSIKMCNDKCDKYQNKRSMLSSVIPNDKLIILSESNNKGGN
jgi:hypothetical protein